MFSKSCEYGIRAVIFLSSKEADETDNISRISKEIDSPLAFTAKILQKLVKGEVLQSVKGPKGGFLITEKSLASVTLLDIVRIIDGENVYNACAIGLAECNDLKPCPLHEKFKSIRKDLKKMLEETSLKDLAIQLDNNLSVLKL